MEHSVQHEDQSNSTFCKGWDLVFKQAGILDQLEDKNTFLNQNKLDFTHKKCPIKNDLNMN